MYVFRGELGPCQYSESDSLLVRQRKTCYSPQVSHSQTVHCSLYHHSGSTHTTHHTQSLLTHFRGLFTCLKWSIDPLVIISVCLCVISSALLTGVHTSQHTLVCSHWYKYRLYSGTPLIRTPMGQKKVSSFQCMQKWSHTYLCQSYGVGINSMWPCATRSF